MIRKDGVYNYSLAAFLKPSDRSVPSKYDVAALAGASGIPSREPVIFCCSYMISLVKQDSLTAVRRFFNPGQRLMSRSYRWDLWEAHGVGFDYSVFLIYPSSTSDSKDSSSPLIISACYSDTACDMYELRSWWL